MKKTCLRIIKTLNGGSSSKPFSGLTKMKSDYIPSMLGVSNVNGYSIEDVLNLMQSGSPD